ncbi:hypothetical protein N836_32910 [Leptolyngbya sp. Heron Island J]|uniref:hypothetical protein n=1 Tax=Leptolyngbya sp. Heron Island J TaxID=1385935 RepID=UPI0003B98FA9|nr:hypothetical protein [Leptolyngbya sp. Heron Island J]ESA38231.1 hypothetical protein N836_32910 [Leptolyngbya sp. Heron Island J]
MPDYSFPKAKPSDGFHLAAKSLVSTNQNLSLSSLVKPVQEPWNRSQQRGLCNPHPEINALLRPLMFHAEPLAPLRQRDEQALEDIFDDIEVEDILTDVCIRLRQLHPEPCWEDDPFDFLQE